MNLAQCSETTLSDPTPTQASSRSALARTAVQHSPDAQALFGLTALVLVSGLAFGILALVLC